MITLVEAKEVVVNLLTETSQFINEQWEVSDWQVRCIMTMAALIVFLIFVLCICWEIYGESLSKLYKKDVKEKQS